MLLALASAAFLGSESLGSRDHILLSQFLDFPFRPLLRLGGSRWRYSTSPAHGSVIDWTPSPRHIAPARTAQETSLPLLHALVTGETTCPQTCSLAALLYCRLFTQLLLNNGATCRYILNEINGQQCLLSLCRGIKNVMGNLVGNGHKESRERDGSILVLRWTGDRGSWIVI
jgi:hypothetical protein